MTRIYIAIDFDGTMVTHEFPEVGADIGAFEWILKAQEMKGVRIILNTMRGGEYLAHAVETCLFRGVKLFGINHNPTQSDWTNSPKVYGNMYIDDAALGTPLITETGKRPWVDWGRVGPMMIEEIKKMQGGDVVKIHTEPLDNGGGTD